MRERPHPTRIPSVDPLPGHTATPQISTPVIDPHRRLPDVGVKITPRLDDEDQRDFAKEDEDALAALEQIERAMRGQMPG